MTRTIPKKVEFLQERNIKLSELLFDIENVRTIHIEIKTQEQAEEFLKQSEEFGGVYKNIKERGLQEALIIDEHKIVREGNRRMAACRQIFREVEEGTFQTSSDFSTIHCKQILPGTSQTDIEAFLADQHIGKKQDWPIFNQAKLLFTLYEDRFVPITSLTHLTKKSKSDIMRRISSYQLLLEYHVIYKGDNNWIKKFYYMWEYLRDELKTLREADPKLDKFFFKLIFHEKFTDSRHIRYFSTFLNNPALKSLLEEQDSSNALIRASTVDPTINSSFFKKIDEITKKLEIIPAGDVLETLHDSAKLKMLKNLETTVKKLIKTIEKAKKQNNN